MTRRRILGVPVDAVTAAEALRQAVDALDAASPGRPALVFTPNPELIMQAQRDAELMEVASAADLALPDGIGVVWALRRQGCRAVERVPGVEFMFALLAWAARAGMPVYLLGARPDVIAEAVRQGQARFAGLRLAGWGDGYFGAAGEDEVVRRVAESGAELLFVGLGVPAQERFLLRHRHHLGRVRLAMGVGGSFDVLSGVVRRAPAAIRAAGLEWLWRLVSQPSRWRRQLALPRFAWAVLWGRSR